MKTNKTNLVNNPHETKTWTRAAASGALSWGLFYSTAASGSACLLSRIIGDSTLAFPDVFVHSLAIFPTGGAFRGWLMWRLRPKAA